ncbi:MAG: DUF1835 domain-containing protein [Gammaproteobacteria bacterium]|nr:DUF1835 domain-containing protein [Gammaproteobacteria bacterium]
MSKEHSGLSAETSLYCVPEPTEALRNSNQEKAVSLLNRYFAGDAGAIAQFRRHHPLASNTDFKPELIDARMLVSSEPMRIKKLSLEKLRKDAKKLLRQVKSSSPEVLKRIMQYHTKSPEQYKLADAQLVIAKENGLASWAKLKAHIEQVDRALEFLGNNVFRPDEKLKTLHIRCGTDIQESLKQCGFVGDYLEISNPFPQGPVPHYEPLEYFVSTRTEFIRNNYQNDLPSDIAKERIENTEQEILHVERTLHNLTKNYQRIVLWFEHDPFDQLCKAYVFAHLSNLDLFDITIECIQIDRFPGVKKFIGIGQLTQTPEVLLALWPRRVEVTAAMLAYGARVWQGFVASDPITLWQLTEEPQVPLPHLQAAVRRMLMELPWRGNGLGLTEHLVLTILAEHGPLRPGAIFNLLMSELEPLPYLGDIMLLTGIRPLWQCKNAAIEIVDRYPDDNPMRRMRLSLTEFGKKLLSGESNWLMINENYVRHLGGVVIRQGYRNWYWSGEHQQPVLK